MKMFIGTSNESSSSLSQRLYLIYYNMKLYIKSKWKYNHYDAETYTLLISIIGSIGMMIYGYYCTLGWILIWNKSSITLISEETIQENSHAFGLKFLILFHSGIAFGSFIGAIIGDKLGRILSLLYNAIISIVLLCGIKLYSNFDFLTCIHIIGWLLGMNLTISPIYLIEMVRGKEKGQVLGVMVLFYIFGSIFCLFFYNLLMNILWLLIFPIVFYLILCIAIIYLPYDTPRFLLAHRTPSECLDCLKTIRKSNHIDVEFNVMYRYLTIDATESDLWISDFLLHSNYIYRNILSFSIQLFHCLTFPILILYSLTWIKEWTIIIICKLVGIFIILIIGTLYSLINIDIIGIRHIIYYGLVIIFITVISHILGQYVYQYLLHQSNIINNEYHIIIIQVIYDIFQYILLLVFICCQQFTIHNISKLYSYQIYPMRFRCISSCLQQWFQSFLLICLFGSFLHYDIDLLKTYMIEYIIISILLLYSCLFYYGIPETKDLMIENMEDLFSTKMISNGNMNMLCCWYSNEEEDILSENQVIMTKYIGLKTLPSETLLQCILMKENGKKGVSSIRKIIPGSLHKYSYQMEHLNFQTITNEDEYVYSSNAMDDSNPANNFTPLQIEQFQQYPNQNHLGISTLFSPIFSHVRQDSEENHSIVFDRQSNNLLVTPNKRNYQL